MVPPLEYTGVYSNVHQMRMVVAHALAHGYDAAVVVVVMSVKGLSVLLFHSS